MTTTVGWSARAIAASVRAGEHTAEQVLVEHLGAIESQEPALRAWASIDRDLALASAQATDADRARDPDLVGPLAGVPVGVKDIVDVAGLPTRNGADVPVRDVATRDATCVARLRAAGATIVGKTVTTEYALFRPGPTLHPDDPTRTPGGSSSGSAAAVRAGMVPLAIGTQTAGSIVRPASFCGVVGAKPTYGSIPREGVTRCSDSLDTVGLLGRSVDDVALGLGVMADDVAGLRPSDRGGRARIGFCRTFEWGDVEPDARRTIDAGVEQLARHLDVVETSLPDTMRGLAAAQRAVMEVEIATELGELRATHGHHLSERLHRVIDGGEGWRWAYAAAREHAAAGRSRLEEVFAEVDVLLVPAALGEAPARDTTGDPLPCRQWTLLGTPCVGVPGLIGPGGLPLGVQVIATHGDDASALGAARLVGELLAS